MSYNITTYKDAKRRYSSNIPTVKNLDNIDSWIRTIADCGGCGMEVLLDYSNNQGLISTLMNMGYVVQRTGDRNAEGLTPIFIGWK